MTRQEQLEAWVRGESLHNPTTDECCPDFSCCISNLLASREDRQLFYEARMTGNIAVESAMLGAFLSAMLKNAFPDRKIHVITDAPKTGEC